MKDKIDKLMRLIPKEQLESVLNQDMCELEPTFLGFTDVYENLSRIIPKHFTVIDFGCYVACQSYYFRKHKEYIGVDTCPLKRVKFSNATHYFEPIQSFISDRLSSFCLNTTFAICSYVPDDNAKELIRKSFTNLFIFYPCPNGNLFKVSR